MKTEIIRLESVVKHGIGGSKTAAINLIYSILLQKHKLDFYSFIFINQIGNDLEEFVLKQGKEVYINIRYPVYENYEFKSVAERNIIRLDIIHISLLKLAAKDSRIEIRKLNTIQQEILQKDFYFYFEYKIWHNKKRPNLDARIIIHPKEDSFDFYVLIEENKTEKCRLLIYKGMPSDSYFEDLFFYGKWKDSNELIISGKNNEMEIHVTVDSCLVEYVNLTSYNNAPFFEMMKADISIDDNTKAHNDYIHSLPPSLAAIITHKPN